MKIKLNSFIHSKTCVIILILLLIAIVSLTGTYAWFTWSSAENTNLTMTISKFADVMFTDGNDIITDLRPVFNYYDGEKTTFVINNRNTTGISVIYTIKLNIDTIPTGLRRSEVKYSLVQNGELIITGNFLNATDSSTIEVFTGALFNGITSCELYLYIDGNVENDSSMMNKTIIGNITLEANEFSGTLAELITNLYTVPGKNTATNNSIKYNYASSASLMNDRLGGVTTDYDAGNIRYYGANPTNYIDVGDRDSNGNVIPWRIIGLFKNIKLGDSTTSTLIKIIRDEEVERSAWDTSASTINEGKGINEWSQADMMKLLNPGYETEAVGGSLFYNSGSGTCYSGKNNATISCDFTSTGISDAVKDKIETVTWNLGGHNNSQVYSNQIYSYERANNVITNPADGIARTTEWEGMVAIIYPSDYGYATNFNYCNTTLGSYGETCKVNDWLFSDYGQYFLTPTYTSPRAAWVQDPPGSLYPAQVVATGARFRPSVYLKSGLTITNGDGTRSNPYVVE